MAQVTVRDCKCKNDYQDKRYGTSQRLMNIADKKKVGSAVAVTCTVCGTSKGQ